MNKGQSALSSKIKTKQMYLVNLTQRDNEFMAEDSLEAQSMQKKNSKNNPSSNPHEIFAYEYQRNTTKLSFLILIYLYTQDDDVITKKEDRSINKILKKKESYLQISDYDQIHKFVEDLPTLNYIMSYIEKEDVKQGLFDDAVATVRKLVKRNSLYREILDNLENKFKATL